MLALTRIFKMKIRWSRTILEVTAVGIGWVLGGPFWLGTLIFAFTIGPAIQLAFKVLRIKRNTDSSSSGHIHEIVQEERT
jgi:hypothetical protein